MVPTTNVVIIVVVLLTSVLLPVIGWFVVRRRFRVPIVSALAGAVVFFICYIVAVFTSMLGAMLIASPIILTLVLSLRAGLVEEFGRFVAFKWVLKRQNAVGDALMYGVGHGGMEVILVLTFAMLNNLIFIFMANAGVLDNLIALMPNEAESIAATISILAETHPLLFAAGLFERVVAMTLHIALSVIVFCAVRQKKLVYLLLAMALHTLLNSCIVLYVMGIVGTWGLEAVLAGVVVVVVLIARQIARRYRSPVEPDNTLPDVIYTPH